MSNSTDRLPHTRDGQLSMAKDWLPRMTANAEARDIPSAVITDFTALTGGGGYGLRGSGGGKYEFFHEF
ncbi:MAG: hypothetical protein LBP20_11155 [Treponema sp.]|nr:hypothetical protein [Treponema sp.]